MPRLKKLTLKKARLQLASMYQDGILSESFALFDPEHYFNKETNTYKTRNFEVQSLDAKTAEFLEDAFLHWIKNNHGDAFLRLKEGLK